MASSASFLTAAASIRWLHGTGTGMKWVIDRMALLATALVVAVVIWVLSRYGKDWVLPISTAIMILGLAFEVSRLRKLLKKHGVDPRNRI
jgi:hypothetical protein